MTDHDSREFARMLARTRRRFVAVLALAVVTTAIFTTFIVRTIDVRTDRGRTRPPVKIVTGETPKITPAPKRRPIEVSPTVVAPAETPEPVMESSMRTVSIKEEVDGELQGYGTGFLFDDGLILTAAHNFWESLQQEANGSGKTVITVYCDGRPSPAKIVRRNDDLDVAVLHARDCHATRLHFAPNENVRLAAYYATGYKYDAKSAEAVTAASRYLAKVEQIHDRGFARTCRQVRRQADRERARPRPYRPSSATFLVFDRAFRPGNSGAPLFDAKGRVVAMFTLFISEQRPTSMGGLDGWRERDSDTGYSCYVPAADLLEVIRDLR